MSRLQQQHSVVDCNTAHREAKKWLYEVANQRLHQTTLERPCDHWQPIEQPLLLPLPSYSPLLTPAQPLERLPLDSQPLPSMTAFAVRWANGTTTAPLATARSAVAAG